MRKILFKAKTEGGRWVEGDLIHYESGEMAILEKPFSKYGREATEIARRTAVLPETICQYSGLTDKKGNKIWENDILKGLFLHGMEVYAVVVFKDGAFGLKWNRGKVEEFSAFTSICNVSFEIIGNVFDNPELLEGGVE